MLKKQEEIYNVNNKYDIYKNADGNYFFSWETGEFIGNFTEEQKTFLLECINNRIPVAAFAYPHLSIDEMQLIYEQGVRYDVDVEWLWELAHSNLDIDHKVCVLVTMQNRHNWLHHLENINKYNPQTLVRMWQLRQYNYETEEFYCFEDKVNPSMTPEDIDQIKEAWIKEDIKKDKLKIRAHKVYDFMSGRKYESMYK